MSRVRIRQAAPKAKEARKTAPRASGRAALRQSAPTPSAKALAAAAAQPTRALPQRRLLEQRFGRDLSGIGVVQSPETERALDTAGAEAATVDGQILLRPGADQATVAHELTHALQHSNGIRHPNTDAETEARRAEALIATDQPVAPIRASLAAGTIAYKMPERLAGARIVPRPDPKAERVFADASNAPQADTAPREQEHPNEPDPTSAAPSPQDQTAVTGAQAPDPDASVAQEEQAVPTFAAPPIPELEVDTEAAEAKAAAAEAKLDTATDATALMTAFRAAPPSVKAQRHDLLAGQTKTLNQRNQTQFEADLPAFEAKLSGTDDLETLPPVAAPGQDAATLETGTPEPAPKPDVSPTQAVTPAKLNQDGGFFAGFFTAGDAGSMGTAFAKVSTRDGEVDTSAGKRPKVPTTGDTDPARIAAQHKAAGDQAEAKRKAATQHVIDGRGPMEVRLRSLQETYPLPARALPDEETADTTASGAMAFREGGHDAEVTALFDAHHAEHMSGSLAQAEADTSAAVTQRDADRDQKVKDAEAETAKLNREADGTQRSEALARRRDIQTARNQAVSDQQTQVTALKTQAETDRKATQAKVDTEISTTDSQVSKDFAKAEEDAKAEVTKGETKAETERTRQKAAASKQSWWDRATNWVKTQFDRLTKFINDVFDAVRKAVKTLIDKVKAAALTLIDKAAKAIKSAIETLGKVLKTAVTALLSKHFPAIAKKLNNAIDRAVAVAKSAVDKLAEGLKTAVAAVLNLLGKAIDGILALYQKAITGILNLVKIALTADWGALAKMILEPILKAFGINPAEFYALIGKAIDALDLIVKKPGQFISNLIKAVVGGLKLFTGKLFEHLQKGIIGWLTGALGSDLKIPKTWSLFGVLDLGRQIMGLTLDFIRRIAVRVVGEKAVTVIEHVMETIGVFMKDGFAGLWTQIKGALGQLQSLVLDQIKTFLMERVLLAAVTWLASLFNPAGAIAKLIMMTWNVLMFIKDQLGRMVELVKKVFGTLYEIATGVLEPAQKGVEAVLGRLLPMTIDLFARLLGLGNVAGRVKKIIDGIRQKIEDAIVKLIKRIAGRGKGKGTKKDDARGKAKGIKPITLKGGGETHTLFVKKKGRDAVPMMRSKELPVETWLKGLESKQGVERVLASQHRYWSGLTPDTKAARVDENHQAVARILTRAKAQEDAMDAAADAAASPSTPEAKVAAAEAAAQQKAQRLARTLEEILDALGVTRNQLALIFKKNLEALPLRVRLEAQTSLLRRLPYQEFATLSWADAVGKAVAHDRVPDKWKRPFHSDGVLRGEKFGRAYDMHMRKVIREENPEFAKKTDEYRKFHGDYLTAALRDHQVPIIKRLMSGKFSSITRVMAAVDEDVKKVVHDQSLPNASAPDMDIKKYVKPGNMKDLMLRFAKDPDDVSFNYYPNNDGKDPQPNNFYWFFTTACSRQGANRTYLADMIRRAPNPTHRPHEFISSEHVAMVAKHAYDTVKPARATANPQIIDDAVSKAQKLVLWQHHVRAPTYNLVFKPTGDFPQETVKANYRSAEHRDHIEKNGGNLADEPSAAQKAEWYQSGQPDFDEEISFLQAHSGGLYAHVSKGNMSMDVKMLSVGSKAWHDHMTDEVLAPGVQELKDTGKDTKLTRALFAGYKDTIWDGSNDFPDRGTLYPYYYFDSSETGEKTYAELKTHFAGHYKQHLKEIKQSIERARTEAEAQS